MNANETVKLALLNLLQNAAMGDADALQDFDNLLGWADYNHGLCVERCEKAADAGYIGGEFIAIQFVDRDDVRHNVSIEINDLGSWA